MAGVERLRRRIHDLVSREGTKAGTISSARARRQQNTELNVEDDPVSEGYRESLVCQAIPGLIADLRDADLLVYGGSEDSLRLVLGVLETLSDDDLAALRRFRGGRRLPGREPAGVESPRRGERALLDDSRTAGLLVADQEAIVAGPGGRLQVGDSRASLYGNEVVIRGGPLIRLQGRVLVEGDLITNYSAETPNDLLHRVMQVVGLE